MAYEGSDLPECFLSTSPRHEFTWYARGGGVEGEIRTVLRVLSSQAALFSSNAESQEEAKVTCLLPIPGHRDHWPFPGIQLQLGERMPPTPLCMRIPLPVPSPLLLYVPLHSSSKEYRWPGLVCQKTWQRSRQSIHQSSMES